MKNADLWKPSKFIRRSDESYFANPEYVGVGSRYICNLFVKDYVRLIREHCRGALLDCGCGDVPYYEAYSKLVASVTCIDWEHSLHENPYVDQYVDLNDILPFEGETFDTILVTDVLEHIAEPSLFMREISRITRPGGRVLIMVPFFYWIHEQPHDYYRYSEFALRRFCAQNSLTVVHLNSYGGYPDILLDLFNKRWIRKESTVRLFLKLTNMISGTRWYRGMRTSTEKMFPLGYCLVAQK